MQIGIRLHDTKPGTLEDRLATIQSQGFTCAHLALTKGIFDFPVNEETLTPGFAMYLKKMFQKHDIDVAVLGCYLNVAHPEDKQLRVIRNQYLANIRFAALLGCGVVGTETGTPNPQYVPDLACRKEEALNLFIGNLRPVVAYAEKLGVIVAIEPVRDHIVYNSARARRVLDEIASPNLQIIFDPVNLLGIDNYKYQKEVFEEAVDLLGKEIAVIHLKDFIVRNDTLRAIAAGEGEMDYEPVLRFIRRKKPYIHCTLENTTPENAITAKEYIEKLYQNLTH